MDSRKRVSATRFKSKSSRGIPVPKNSHDLIMLTGLVHIEAGRSLGRQLAFCTAEEDGYAGFYLGPEDLTSPEGVSRSCRRP